jgi:hypothetical protein
MQDDLTENARKVTAGEQIPSFQHKKFLCLSVFKQKEKAAITYEQIRELFKNQIIQD